MTYKEGEQVKLRRQGTKQAIALAMQGRWREAVEANKDIIESFPNDVDAYNRLGKAYMELGEYSPAREAYSRVTELDPYNTIAQKNLHRLVHLGEAPVGAEGDSLHAEPQHFIEEIGKAGVVNLVHLAPWGMRAKMAASDRAYLRISKPSLIVENVQGEYLGQVEPKHSQRLISLMEGGNKYIAAIVSSTEDRMAIIVRETYQDPSQAGRPSFPSKRLEALRPYVSNRLLKRELESEEELAEESGYTVIGGGEVETLPVEATDIDDVTDEE